MKNHKWIDKGSFQWGDAGVSPKEAHTHYECEFCGAKIELYYHNNDTHALAMVRNGVAEECEKAPEETKTGKEKKIFCFVNSSSPGWYAVLAMCEDGHVLGSHVSSNEGWAKHDIGIGSDWKHDGYKEHCPDGYELIWLEEEELKDEAGEFHQAYLKNQELGKLAESETEKEIV